jgi:hypothetical protein
MNDCLICLLPCSCDIIQCRNKHEMHMQCFRDMVQHMGKINCPYCSSYVPAVRALKFKAPSRFKRTFIAFEHCLFMLFLVPNFLLNYRAAWAINRKLMHIRLRFDNVSPLHGEIREFRSFMMTRISRILPLLCLGVEFVIKTTPWTWLDAVKVALAFPSFL